MIPKAMVKSAAASILPHNCYNQRSFALKKKCMTMLEVSFSEVGVVNKQKTRKVLCI